jgi:hypothetical protein
MSRHFGLQTSTARKIIGQATPRPVDHHAKRMLRTEGNDDRSSPRHAGSERTLSRPNSRRPCSAAFTGTGASHGDRVRPSSWEVRHLD